MDGPIPFDPNNPDSLTPDQLQQLAMMAAFMPHPTPFATTARAVGFETGEGYQGFVEVTYHTSIGNSIYFHENRTMPGYIDLLKKRHRESIVAERNGLIVPGEANNRSGLHIIGGDHA